MKLLNNKFVFLSLTLFSKILLNLVIVFYIAKQVSLDSFGEFILAFSFSTIFTMFFDYGFNLQALVLDSTNSKFKETINAIIGGKSLIIIGTLPVILVAISLSTYSNSLKSLLYILTFSGIFTSFGNFFLNLFKIVERYDREAKGYAIQVSVLFLTLMLLYISGNNSVINFSLSILLSKIIYFAISFIFYKKWLRNKFVIHFDKIKKQITDGFTFAVHLILGTSIIYIDTFILSYFQTAEAVGLYQAGMRIIMASLLMSTIINDAYLPKISLNKWNNSVIKDDLVKLSIFLLIIIVSLGFTLYVFKKEIISVLYTDDFLVLTKYIIYIILIISLRYIGIIPGMILTAYGRQSIRAKAVFLSVIVGACINFYLIPIMGLEGAFIASLTSHIVLNSIYILYAIPDINRIMSTQIK